MRHDIALVYRIKMFEWAKRFKDQLDLMNIKVCLIAPDDPDALEGMNRALVKSSRMVLMTDRTFEEGETVQEEIKSFIQQHGKTMISSVLIDGRNMAIVGVDHQPKVIARRLKDIPAAAKSLAQMIGLPFSQQGFVVHLNILGYSALGQNSSLGPDWDYPRVDEYFYTLVSRLLSSSEGSLLVGYTGGCATVLIPIDIAGGIRPLKRLVNAFINMRPLSNRPIRHFLRLQPS